MTQIKTPTNKQALASACMKAGMSDGAKEALVAYFDQVVVLYDEIVSQAPSPAPVTPTYEEEE